MTRIRAFPKSYKLNWHYATKTFVFFAFCMWRLLHHFAGNEQQFTNLNSKMPQNNNSQRRGDLVASALLYYNERGISQLTGIKIWSSNLFRIRSNGLLFYLFSLLWNWSSNFFLSAKINIRRNFINFIVYAFKLNLKNYMCPKYNIELKFSNLVEW